MIDQRELRQKALPLQTRESLIHFEDVSIAFEELSKPVIHDVSLQVREGESVLFLGPSGCGKSTLAMLCARLIPSSVEAQVKGELHYHPSLCSTGGIGYVFQDPDAQFCMIHVDDEVAFGLENVGVPRDDMRSVIRASLESVHLDVPMDAQHATFSGGMKQKLAVASALALKPKLLIFDEPTANLDPLSTRVVFEQIARLHEQGQTLIVIEHKFDPLLPHMDTVVLFDRDGSVRRVGPTREVLTEEWAWMVDAGVVPAWKGKPTWLVTNARSALEPAHQPLQPRQRGRSVPVDKPAISLHGLSLRYGERLIWSNVDLMIPVGAFVAVVGPNGAGKSSLLQVMAGLQKPASGHVTWFGRALKDLSATEKQRMLSFCFQNPEYQFIYERVGDELANGVVQGDLPPQVTRLLEEFGLAGLEDHSPFALSQGQKRRLSVAAMVREEHDLYLLDEPTFGQDARTQLAILERLAQLQDQGKTVVITTHDMDLVRTYATHVAVLCDGGIAFFGSPDDLFERPDVLRQAHLLADVEALEPAQEQRNQPEKPWRKGSDHLVTIRGQRGLSKYLNPPLSMLAVVATVLVGIAARKLPQTLALFVWGVLLLLVVPGLSPRKVLKRLSPFLGFYVLYIWTFAAFSAVPPGAKSLHVLWYHISLPGLMTGVVLAFRMLAAVAMGVLLVASTEMTSFIVGVCQNFRLAPKFAYGILAGLRLAPLFQNEWMKLRQARQLRGKDARWPWMRPVTYALPLLTQAIRMSERVATAMEARGFVGEAANSAQGRTFYRVIRIHWWDWAYMFALPGVALALIILFK